MTQFMSVKAIDKGMINNNIEIVELGEEGGKCVNSFTFLANSVPRVLWVTVWLTKATVRGLSEQVKKTKSGRTEIVAGHET